MVDLHAVGYYFDGSKSSGRLPPLRAAYRALATAALVLAKPVLATSSASCFQ